MSGKIYGIAGFILGAGTGVFATWKLLNSGYEKRYQEEVESLRESMANRKPASFNDVAEAEVVEQARNKPNISEVAAAIVEREGYTDYSNITSPPEDDPIPEPAIYIISPDEFGEKPGFDAMELTYYSDGVLEDDSENVVGDPEELIGPEALGSFGTYEDDSVYVRNELRQLDIQILYDEREYSEVSESRPPKSEA